MGVSSKGRTRDFESLNLGSSPSAPSSNKCGKDYIQLRVVGSNPTFPMREVAQWQSRSPKKIFINFVVTYIKESTNWQVT